MAAESPRDALLSIKAAIERIKAADKAYRDSESEPTSDKEFRLAAKQHRNGTEGLWRRQ